MSGKEVIAPAVHTGKIDVLAFIGSSQVANQIKLAHPHRTILEVFSAGCQESCAHSG
jgi:hypothetical protein